MGKVKRFISREEVERAMKCTRSNRAAAHYLRASYEMYRRYASMYKNEDGISLYEAHMNQSGKGVHKFFTCTDNGTRKKRRKREPLLMDILDGKISGAHYNPQKLKYRLLDMHLLKPKCARCGFKEQRIVDGKSPLILHHKNGNNGDWRLENLEFLCYNCSFLEGGSECPITEEFVEKAEDYVERQGNNKKQVYELDDYQREFLKNLGMTMGQKPYEPGDEYIATL